jgi:hypothetical protein
MRGLLASLLMALLPAQAQAFGWHRQDDLPQVIGPRDPSDPGERVPRTTYQSVTAPAKSFRPVAPLSWEEMNRRVMPRPKAGSPEQK